VTLERYYGAEVERHWEELGRLRIKVFREFPYLYAGSLDYERGYLEPYWRSADSLLVLVRDVDGQAVGATTGLPLAHEAAELQAPFESVEGVFYFGESVVLPRFRGRGLGQVFFDEREAHARTLAYRVAGFYAVERPADHARRPGDYRPLDEFWRRRGYAPQPELRTEFSWRDLDEGEESPKPMQFWLRTL